MRLVTASLTVGLSVVAVLCCGCMTVGVIDRAAGRSSSHASITQVKEVARLDGDLFLQLGVESEMHPGTRTVLLRVPLSEIGVYRDGKSGTRLETDELRLQPPHIGYWVEDGLVPPGSSAVETEYVDVNSDIALDQRLASLSPGVHVLIVLDSDSYHERMLQPSVPRDGAVPGGVHIILANGIEGQALEESRLWLFDEARKKNRAWLLLTPLTVVGDIVTFPIQLITGLGD